jgi:hypothetical protein
MKEAKVQPKKKRILESCKLPSPGIGRRVGDEGKWR